MRLLETDLPGVLLIEPDVFHDDRGLFMESYHAEKYSKLGISSVFVQDNFSSSVKGTLRGLHAQLQKPQGKLIRVTKGEIFDVAVDARPGSQTFGKWFGTKLSEKNSLQLYIPAGFFHGYCVLTDKADVEYKCTNYYDGSDEVGIIWNDSTLNINWPIDSPILSVKDNKLPVFNSSIERFEAYRSL
jgi:dTDP-4-dehydrorhamnose 3,5-epimerase